MFTIISSPGSMASTWLSKCFECVADTIVFHGDINQDKLGLGYSSESVEKFFSNILELVEREKKHVVCIHTVPMHGCKLMAKTVQNGGNFYALVREPIQSIDSQIQYYEDVKYIRNMEKLMFYFFKHVVPHLHLFRNIATFNSIPFVRVAIEHISHLSSLAEPFVKSQKMMKKTGILKFEEYTNDKEFLKKILGNATNNQPIDLDRLDGLFETKVQVHRDYKKTSSDIYYNLWNDEYRLIFQKTLAMTCLIQPFKGRPPGHTNDVLEEKELFKAVGGKKPIDIAPVLEYFFGYSVDKVY